MRNKTTVLYGIPISLWVRGTAAKMKDAGSESWDDWGNYWLEVYRSLGGESEGSGSKHCPKAAAYGLWVLGRIRGTCRSLRTLTVQQICTDLGKNAAYALIAIELINEGTACSVNTLWPQVQAKFASLTGDKPADSEQGQVKIVIALFNEGLLSRE